MSERAVLLPSVRPSSVLLCLNLPSLFPSLRGTNAFTILLSSDGNQFQEALRGSLENVANQGCDVAVVDFYLGGERTERYVKLVLNSFYGAGAGMQWINFEQKGAPGPAAAAACECLTACRMQG